MPSDFMPTDGIIPSEELIVRMLGLQPYLSTWENMKAFVEQKTINQDLSHNQDEVWLLEHPPVFTLGQAALTEHLLNPKDIPIIQVDRGGQVTYHGPGQLIGYVFIDIYQKKWGPKRLVEKIEEIIIDLLYSYGLLAEINPARPGVYIKTMKIASIGLRIRKGCSYHGFALNVKMDMEPFSRINPCGYKEASMTQLCQYLPDISMSEVCDKLITPIQHTLQFKKIRLLDTPWQKTS